ncbi:hypothetical protein AC1031_003803 [Aphanomyces cochlioides]|nr:hypothetical protein AC1031_003803 [Aphanomyces cochlioides]
MSASHEFLELMPLAENSLDQFKAAQEDVKQITVHSTASSFVEQGGRDPFTLYTLIVTCPATKMWWIIKKRYSEFHTLHRYLVKMHKSSKMPKIRDVLRPIVEVDFPKRSIRLDNEITIAKRKLAFDNIVAMLMAIRSDCICAMVECKTNSETLQQLIHVCSFIEAFLAIPELQKKEEVHRTSLILSSPELVPHVVSYNDDECPICLSDFEDPEDKTLHLGCGHIFHEDCVMQWLQLKLSCPTCRETSICGVSNESE